MIKMIVTDLDGTLLRADKTVSADTETVLNRCRAQGIKLVFATARPIRAVRGLNLPLNFDAGVYHNGAVIHIGNVAPLLCGIAPPQANRLLQIIFQWNREAKVFVEYQDRALSNFDAAAVWRGTVYEKTDYAQPIDATVDKIIVVEGDSAQQEALRAKLPADVCLIPSKGSVWILMHRDAVKEKAVARVAAAFQIPLAEITAFGDDENDLEMLRICGAGVAMENAPLKVKAAANHVCGNNHADGLAKWLEENGI